jgi:cytidylate kinase
MSIDNFLDSINLSLEYQYDHVKKAALECPRLFLTLSRQPGAGAISIGEKIAEFLNAEKKITWPTPWKVFDKDLLKTIVEEHNLPEKCKKYMPEGKLSTIQDILDDMLGLHPSAIALVHRTNETLLHLAHLGNTIIVGRGGCLVTRKLQGGFHVRLVGSLDKRVRRVIEFSKLNKNEAEKLVAKEEKDRKKYFDEYFNKNIEDPSLYDLTLNTDFISFDDAAKIIVHAALIAKYKLEK